MRPSYTAAPGPTFEKSIRDERLERLARETARIGFTACWKQSAGGRCRKPEGHDGDCAPS